MAAKKTLEPSEKEKEKKPAMKSGFFNDPNRESLYGPEGSEQGVVTDEQKKKWQEKELNDNMNKKMGNKADPKKGQSEEDEKPPWYTNQWPRHCQYNSPACVLDPLDESKSKSEFHKENLRSNARWQKLVEGQEKEIRLGYNMIPDDMIPEIVEHLKKSGDVVEVLDLSNNDFHDGGIQNLVAELAAGLAPNLKELIVYGNKFGDMGKTMLTAGLSVMRKDLKVQIEPPEYLKNAQASLEKLRLEEAEKEKAKEQELD